LQLYAVSVQGNSAATILFPDTMLTLPLPLWVLRLKASIWQVHRAWQVISIPLPGGGGCRSFLPPCFSFHMWSLLCLSTRSIYTLLFLHWSAVLCCTQIYHICFLCI